MNQIDEMSRAIGRIEQKVDDLCGNFSKLPCARDDKRISELEVYKNQMVGKISVIATICGIIGYAMSMIVSWIFNNIKVKF